MLDKDLSCLEEAYLSVRKKLASTPSDVVSGPSVEPNDVVSAGPVDEPAPGVDMDMVSSANPGPESSDLDTTGIPVTMSAESDPRFSEEDETEEDNMTISNLHSIRESIMKIAQACSAGTHLEPWQQQKLAIAMDNLAEVARRIPSGC